MGARRRWSATAPTCGRRAVASTADPVRPCDDVARRRTAGRGRCSRVGSAGRWRCLVRGCRRSVPVVDDPSVGGVAVGLWVGLVGHGRGPWVTRRACGLRVGTVAHVSGLWLTYRGPAPSSAPRAPVEAPPTRHRLRGPDRRGSARHPDRMHSRRGSAGYRRLCCRSGPGGARSIERRPRTGGVHRHGSRARTRRDRPGVDAAAVESVTAGGVKPAAAPRACCGSTGWRGGGGSRSEAPRRRGRALGWQDRSLDRVPGARGGLRPHPARLAPCRPRPRARGGLPRWASCHAR